MPTTVLLAPVGAGKTEVSLEHLIATIHDQNKPFIKIWALLATKRQENSFRERLIEWQDGRSVYFNVEFFNFYELYARLLDVAGTPPRRLNDSARFALLRAIVSDLDKAGQLTVFGSIAKTPGFIAAIADFIAELKSNINEPHQFLDAAEHKGITQKDREIYRIYDTYHTRLREYNLVDKEGEGWLALAETRAQKDVATDVALLMVDGYDQFTPVQANLLALLSGRVGELRITLTTVPGRKETVGRRFENTRKQLEEFHERERVPCQTRKLPGAREQRHADLIHIGEMIFNVQAQTRSAAPDSALCIEAPSEQQEVAGVLRQIKRLLLDGARPDSILIALRDWERYRQHFMRYRQEYGLPLALHYGEPLKDNPAVIALVNLLELHEQDFRRRDLLDVLRSPYVAPPGLGTAQIDQLDRISRQLIVARGRDSWLLAIDRAWDVQAGDEDLDEPFEALINHDEATQLSLDLENFFAQVTPKRQATVAGYVEWLEVLIGTDSAEDPDEEPFDDDTAYSLAMIRQIRQPSNPLIIARDLSAIHEVMRILRGLLSAARLLESLDQREHRISWTDFKSDFLSAIRSTSVNAAPSRVGRVLVTTATNARGLPHEHVFIVGLAEGVFPQAIPEDPIYLDTERQALQAAGINLQTQAERANDDGLFYELISLPRQTLTVSRPTVNNGKLWIESHLWRQVNRVLTDIPTHTFRIGQVLPVESAASAPELVLSVADGLNLPELRPRTVSALTWLNHHHPATLQQVVIGRQIEMGRMARGRHDHFSGRLNDDDLIDRVAGILGQHRIWSASQFNDYGYCGFRFFAKRLLKLEKLDEPEEGIDAAQLGGINHEILERTYRELLDMPYFEMTPEYFERDVIPILHEIAEEVFAAAPRRYGFRETPRWQEEQSVLLRRLEALVRLDFSEDSPVIAQFGHAERQLYRLEAPFGMDGIPAVTIDLNDDLTIQVAGFIDRIDKVGNRAVIVDYKTGSGKIPIKEMEEGRNFQMMVYLLASDALLKQESAPDAPKQVAGGFFWHIRNQDISGTLTLDDNWAQISDAKTILTRYIQHAREGDFSVHPNKPENSSRCVRYCEFHQLCRASITNRRKA